MRVRSQWRLAGRRPIATLMLAGGAVLANAWAAPPAAKVEPAPRLLTLADYPRSQAEVRGLELSPDGRRVAVRWRGFRDGDQHRRAWVELRELATDVSLELGDVEAIGFDATGTRYRYAASTENGGTEFVELALANGARRSRLTVEAPLLAQAWHRGSDRLAWIDFTPATPPFELDRGLDPAQAGQGSRLRIATQLHHRDGDGGLLESGVHRVHVAAHERAEATAFEVPFGTRMSHLDELRWQDDGAALWTLGNPSKNADREEHRSSVLRLDPTRRHWAVAVGQEGGFAFWSGPRPSPDGRVLAYRGYQHSPDATVLYELPANLRLRDLTNGRERAIEWPMGDVPEVVEYHWVDRGRALLAIVDWHGASRVFRIGRDGRVDPLHPFTRWCGPESLIRDLSFADERVAFVCRSPHGPQHGVVGSLADPDRPVLRIEASDRLQDLKLAVTERLRVRSAHGRTVDAFITWPPVPPPPAGYPLILDIHGGPFAMDRAEWSFERQYLAARGYAVAAVNYRGSSGYGIAFAREGVGGPWPNDAMEDDLLAVVDALIRSGRIDRRRIVAYGASAGGVLSTWMVGRHPRFAGAIVQLPFVNWTSQALTSAWPLYYVSQFPRSPFEDPMLWWNHSPLARVPAITVPVLIVAGREDPDTPVSEARALHSALELGGRSDATLIEHPYGHSLGEHDARTYRQLLNVFVQWLDRLPPRPQHDPVATPVTPEPR